MQKYSAFGLTIESEIGLPQVPLSESDTVDVTIHKTFLSESDVSEDETNKNQYDIRFEISDAGRFRITNGNLIEVYPLCEDTSGLPIYLLGSCMGAIIHQRGEMPLHGSCVSNGEDTILITGESGAGKSTLASVFLKHGWKLLTDDVAIIIDPEHKALVQPSYPSQKIWGDSPEFRDKDEKNVHSLYERDGKNKFGVLVNESFINEQRPLTMILKLTASDLPTQFVPITGFEKVNQLMRNTYRLYMLNRDGLEKHFQKCVTMSLNIPMYHLNRNAAEDNREELFALITERNTESTMETHVMDENIRLKRKEDIITADMQGSAVTMDINTGEYYDLGETGGAIWNFLKEEMSYKDLIETITSEYDVSKEQCKSDVEPFLQKLINDGLILEIK